MSESTAQDLIKVVTRAHADVVLIKAETNKLNVKTDKLGDRAEAAALEIGLLKQEVHRVVGNSRPGILQQVQEEVATIRIDCDTCRVERKVELMTAQQALEEKINKIKHSDAAAEGKWQGIVLAAGVFLVVLQWAIKAAALAAPLLKELVK